MPYSPASNTTGNLPQTAAVLFDKNFIANLKTETVFLRVSSKRELPPNSGNTIKLFSYTALGANTTPATEGTVGSGTAVAVSSVTATPGTYADYCNFSSLALATAIDPLVENISKELAYRLGLTLSAVSRATLDTANSVDASVLVQLGASSTTSFTPLSLDVIREQTQALAGRSVPGFDGNFYAGVIHPFALGDMTTAGANNSVVDILKHTPEGLMRLDQLGGGEQKQVIELPSTNVRFLQTNAVAITSNYQGITGLNALRTYIVGADGLISVPLVAPGDTNIDDGDYHKLVLNIRENLEPSAADPEGLIPGFCSYRVNFAAALPPGTTQRARCIDAASAIS